MANGARRRRSSGGARRSGGGSRGGSRGSGGGSRGGGGGRARGGGRSRGGSRGGGNNAMPMVIGIVVIIAVIGVIAVAVGSKAKKKEPYVSTELTADSNVEKPVAPVKPQRSPPPNLPADVIASAKEVVLDAADKKARGDALYDEAMAAKAAGDRDTWQAKLKEASVLFNDIKESWNNVIGDIEGLGVSNNDWDSEQLANHWLGKEGGKITKFLEPLAYIKKQLGAK